MVSAIILNYNSSADSRKCIGDLLAQIGVELEVIVVDNCSETEERKAIVRRCSELHVTFIPADKNRGYNAGNNIGLRYAAERGAKYALIANPDMQFPERNYIAKLVGALEHDKDIVAVGSDILTPTGIHQNPRSAGKKGWWHSFDWILALFTKKGADNTPDWVDNPKESRQCSYLNGCCLLLDMEFVKEIGFFDERTFLYGEEPILGRQAEIAGKKMYYFAGTHAIHNHRKSKEGPSTFCNKHWKKSRLLYIWHYSGYPVFGKYMAALSTHLYFFTLNAYHRLKGR